MESDSLSGWERLKAYDPSCFSKAVIAFLSLDSFSSENIPCKPKIRSNLTQIENLIRETHYILSERLGMIKCPRCGTEISTSTKKWDYSVFHVKKFDCEKCGKGFMAYYREGKLSHTIPKRK